MTIVSGFASSVLTSFDSLEPMKPYFFRSLYENVGVVTILSIVSLLLMFDSVTFAQDGDSTSRAVALFNSGQDAHEKGDVKTAIDNYEKALKLLPRFPEAEFQRGSAYQSLGKLDEAETAFRKAVELRDDWSLALASLGSVLVGNGKWIEAEKTLDEAIATDDLNFPAYAAMTELRLKTKAPPEALNTLLAKIRTLTAKANPTASIWASRAALEIATGDRKSAKASSERALQLDSRSLSALSTSAELSLGENDPASAEAFVKKLESLAPRSQTVKGFRARIFLAQGRSADALELLGSVEKPEPEILELRNQVLASSSASPADLEKQLGADPKSASLLSRLCTAFRISDPAKALDYCRRASEAAPQSVEPVIGYAAALVQAKRYEEAVSVLRRLLTTAPENSTVHANLGTALFQLKRYSEAKVEFRWLTDHQPDQAAAYYFLAIVHDQLLEFPDAAANYQQFLRLADPESSKLEIEKVNLRLPVVHSLIKEGKGKKRG